MGRTTSKRTSGRRQKSYGLLQTPEQRRWQAQHRREQDEFARYKNNTLRFWRACRNKRCMRARACAGEPLECFRVNWEKVPDEVKEWYRAGIKARARGLSPEEAKRLADAAFIRAVRMERAQAQMTAAAWEPALPAETTKSSPSSNPRVRSL